MGYNISQQIPQGSDRAQEAENRRITALADELSRFCRIHETQYGVGKGDGARDIFVVDAEIKQL